jgi:hypothetical protein
MFRQKFSQFFGKPLYNKSHFKISTKEHKNNFDEILRKYVLGLFPGKSVALSLAGMNLAFWFWCNASTKKEKRWDAFEKYSYSKESFKNRDYANLFLSPLVSRRVDDLIFDTGILITLGRALEKKHGLPFFFKLFLCTYYIGILTSVFFVDRDIAKRERYHFPNPMQTTIIGKDYYYMSSHGISSSVLYFFLYKNKLSMAILPLMAVDLYIWGPYFSSGMLAGVAFGAIL